MDLIIVCLLASQISLLFAQLHVLPLTIPYLHGSLLRYLTALFVAAVTSIWLGPGLKFLQRVWQWNSATTEHEPMSLQESDSLSAICRPLIDIINTIFRFLVQSSDELKDNSTNSFKFIPCPWHVYARLGDTRH